MSIETLMNELNNVAIGENIDFGYFHKKIAEEHKNSVKASDKVICLRLFRSLTDLVLNNLTDDDKIAEFRNLSQRYYKLMLTEECIATQDKAWRYKGMADPTVMFNILSREVKEGRMSAHDDLYRLTLETVQNLSPPSTQNQTRGIISKISSLFRR